MRSSKIAQFFNFTENHTTLRTEIIAGCTTFLAMVYIVVVCPSILKNTGMDPQAVFTATCCASAFGSVLMGIWSNYPIALAPSMSLLSYFAYSVVQKAQIPWQVALGLVFFAGILFFLLTLTRIRQQIIYVISPALKLGITAGIGLFLGAIALKNVGILTVNHYLHLTYPLTFSIVDGLCLLGLLLIFLLDHLRIPGAILISILAMTVIGIFFHLTDFQGIFSLPPSILPVAGALHITDLFQVKFLGIIFTFLLVALFDNSGTLIAILYQAKIVKPDGEIPRLTQALTTDSIATVGASLLGVSSVGSFIESSAGVRAGGRTGLVAVVVAVLFLGTLFFSPLVAAIPAYATASALLYVAVQMLRPLRFLPWHDWVESITALMITLTIPLTFSIADGIGIGFIFYSGAVIVTRQWHKLSIFFCILTLVFVLYLFWH